MNQTYPAYHQGTIMPKDYLHNLVESASAQTLKQVVLLDHINGLSVQVLPSYVRASAQSMDEQALADLREVLTATGELFEGAVDLMPDLLIDETRIFEGAFNIATIVSLLQSIREQAAEAAAGKGHGTGQNIAIIRQTNRLICSIKRAMLYPSWIHARSPLTLTQAAVAMYKTAPQALEIYRNLNVPIHKADGVNYVLAGQAIGITREDDEQDDKHMMMLYEMASPESTERAMDFFMPKITQIMLNEIMSEANDPRNEDPA